MANITGTDGDNVLTGTVNDDVINGLAGNDIIDAGDGNDIIIGGLGADKMSGGIGNDEFLVGGTEIVAGETIDGGTGNNKISTWGGDLSLATITNVQTLGLHLNSLKLSAAQMAGFTNFIAYNNAPVTLTAANAGTYSLANKTVTGTFNLTGSSGNDKLVGNAAAQTLDGGDGNDTIVGGLGADTMLGGAGDDEFLAGGTEIAAGEIIDGGTGYNTLSTWGGDLSLATITNVQKLGVHLNNIKLTAAQLTGFWDIQAYDGPVTITAASAGIYLLPYRSVIGTFNFIGSAGKDFISGGFDISGNPDVQTIDGGGGDDYLALAKTIHGGDGDDTLDALFSGSTLYGDAGNDVLHGGSNADTLFGGDGDDWLIGASGTDSALSADIMDGGNGNDKLQGGLGADILTGGAGADTFTYLTTADSTTTQTDVITDFVEGTDKIDVTGLGFGGLSTSVVKAGQLKVSYDAALNRTTIADLFGSNFSLILNGNHLNIGSNDFIGLQNVINGTNGNDYLVGTAQNDILSGLDGNDVLQGGLGADTMLGGAGDDEFLAGGTEIVAGEVIDGGTGYNTLSTWGGDLSLATIMNVQKLGLHLDHIKLTSEQMAGFLDIEANDGTATITAANSGVYQLPNRSVAGTFKFVGSSGRDDIYGNSSVLSISGGDGDDYLTNAKILHGDNGNDSLIGGDTADSVIYGDDGDDYLTAGSTGCTMDGGNGNDAFTGGVGVDTMLGGAGDDLFRLYEGQATAGDVIDGGSGYNTLGAMGILSGMNISNIQHLIVWGYHSVILTNTQFYSFSKIEGYIDSSIIGADAGVYDLGKINATGLLNLGGSSGSDVLLGTDAGEGFSGNGGTDTIYAKGGNDSIYGYDGDTIYGGTGNDQIRVGDRAYGTYKLYGEEGDDAFRVDCSLQFGSVINGGTGNNTLTVYYADISRAAISNISSLEVTNTSLSNFQFNSITRITGGALFAVDGGVYNLKMKQGLEGGATFEGSAYDDTIIVNDLGQTLYGYLGNDTLVGGLGGDTYYFGRTNGKDIVIENGSSPDAIDSMSFRFNISYDQLWFTQSGSDLVIQTIGTTDSVTVKDWYLGSAHHVEQILSYSTRSHMLLDTQVQNLVNAMAGFAVPSTMTLSAAYHAALDPVLAANWT